jgi:phosphoglycolate phosphatase-like HAD superfamily hydrolase
MLELLLPGISKAQQDELAKEQGLLYQKDYLPLVRPFAGVPELFRKTKTFDLKVGLATTCEPEQLRVYCDLLGVTDMIDATACGADVEHGKPHPDLFQACLRELGADPHATTAVGDSPYDALAARSVGIKPIGLETGGFSRAALAKAGCHAVFSDPVDLLNRWEYWLQERD